MTFLLPAFNSSTGFRPQAIARRGQSGHFQPRFGRPGLSPPEQSSQDNGLEDTTGRLCIAVFEDSNGNYHLDDEEVSIPDSAVIVENQTYTFTKDEPFICIPDLLPDTLTITATVPSGYYLLTGGTLEVSLFPGQEITAYFPAQQGDTELPAIPPLNPNDVPPASAERDIIVSTSTQDNRSLLETLYDNSAFIILGLGIIIILGSLLFVRAFRT
jgi:hypothetical protein